MLHRFFGNRSSFMVTVTLVTAVLLTGAGRATAAQLSISGGAVSSSVSPSSFVGLGWILDVVYTESTTTAIASMSSATLRVGNEFWSALAADTATNKSQFLFVSPGQLQISAYFAPSSTPGSRGSLATAFSLSLNGTPFDNTGFATENNLLAILNSAPLSQQGSITIVDIGPSVESVTIQRAAPEPATWAMFAGCSIVIAGRAYRRRRTSSNGT